MNAYGTIIRDEGQTTDIIWVNADQERERFKYSKSEWIADLNATDARSLIFDMPTVTLPDLPLTTEVTRFLNDAESSFKDGRWGDVLGDCRKAMNALYNGIDQWGAVQNLTREESQYIQSQGEKVGAQRNVYFSRLLGHPEKGERLNKLRTSLYQYLSLEPHESDYGGVIFNRDDAMFVLRITYGFVANILHILGSSERAH